MPLKDTQVYYLLYSKSEILLDINQVSVKTYMDDYLFNVRILLSLMYKQSVEIVILLIRFLKSCI